MLRKPDPTVARQAEVRGIVRSEVNFAEVAKDQTIHSENANLRVGVLAEVT